MPKVWAEDDEYAIIRELLDEQRRHGTFGAAQEPIWTHDTFTAPATYQLTYIPYGINALADNGSVLSEGTDYTVDYTTGLITFVVGRTAGHVIFVSYVTNGDLVAASGPADLGFTIVDTFNRADSTSTINPRSDGGSWTLDPGVVGGISSNQGYNVTGMDGKLGVYADLGVTSTDVQVTNTNVDPGFGNGALAFCINRLGSPSDGYLLWWLHDTSIMQIHDYHLGNNRATVTGFTTWRNSTTTLRVTFNAATNLVTVYQNGTSIWSGTVSGAISVGSWVGFSTSSGSGDRWDNFQAKPL